MCKPKLDKLKKILFFVVLLLSFLGSAQEEMRIKVALVDTNAGTVVRDAVGIVKRVRDSVLLDFKRADKYGKMEFVLPVDTVEFVITHPEYGDFRSFFFGSTDNNEFILDPLQMPEKTTNLDEVLIYANKNPIYYRGDTLVYVADSFKVKENAVVEDLIRKLPGMTIDANGKITNQGKEIGQVLVDGDEFFGSDPTIATKNLAAKGVDKVEVYEKDAEDGSDDKIQVLDLKLKEEAKKGYFGKVNLAGGIDKFVPSNRGFYEGELLLNKYSKDQKIAVYALGSNTPKTNLNSRDLFKFGLSEGRNWMEESDDIQSYSSGSGMNENQGIPSTFKGGFYFDQKLWKGARVRLNYSLAEYQVKSVSNSRSQYLLSDTSYTTVVDQTNQEKYLQNQIGIKFTQQIDSLSRIEVEPKLQFNNTSQETGSITSFISQRDTTTRHTDILNNTDATGASLNTTVRYYKDFKKKNRKLNMRYNFSGGNSSSNGNLFSVDTNAITLAENYRFDQKKENRNKSIANTVYADYFEPIGKKWKMEFEYEYYQNNNSQRKTTLNPINGEYVEIDTIFSNSFDTKRQQHRAGAFAIYENAKLRVSVGSRVRNINIVNRNLFTDSNINQGLTNILPRVVFRYKFSQTSRFSVQYNTNSTLPTIDQLQPVLNNSNPNFINVGNSDLKPNYVHTITGSYNMWRGLSGFYVYSGFSYNHMKDNFSTSTTFDYSTGRTISKAINVNRSDYLYYWAGTGIPFKKIKDMRLNINLNGNFTSSQNEINGAMNDTRNTGIGTDMSLNYNGDSLRVELGGGINYNVPFNSLTTQSNQPYTSYDLKANIDWTLPHRWFIQSDATYTINTGRTSGYNLNYVIWNASFQRSFLKTGNLLLGVEAYDILNQNTSNYRTVNNNVIVDQKVSIIRRYFMLKMTLRFNNNHTKEEDFNGWH